jgi:hypothetical protein
VEARATIQRRLAEREDRFLRLLERGVFAHPGSPYQALLREAGCEFGDVAESVRRHGIEPTLKTLLSAGVSVTFDQFKGRSRQPWHGSSAACQASDFDNPHLSCYYTGTTGGSSGAGTRVSMEFEHYRAQASHELVATVAHDLVEAPTAAWLSVLPSPACFGVMLRRVPFRRPLERWFSQVTEREAGAQVKDRMVGQTILASSRLLGQPFPRPEHVPLDRAATVATWARQAADAHGRSVLITHVSCAVRVALAARDSGFDLDGVVMWAGSEPPTPAKVGLIRASGAHWVPGYWMIEAGFLAQGCAQPIDDTDVHLFSDAFSLIASPQPASSPGGTVDAFYLTTLLPSAPKLMLNVEIDDFGIIEERSCGCPLDELGLGVHLRQVHSLRKLTGEGMTLLGGEASRILEEELPARCGGTALDYQLQEEEGESGLTRVILVASPRVPVADEIIHTAFLASLDGNGPGAGLARATWVQADALRIRREEPRATVQGKLPLLGVSADNTAK